MEQLSLFDDQIDELIPDRSEVPKVAQETSSNWENID